MVALKEFTQTLTSYNDFYASASVETKAEWKENIDPWFRTTNKALIAWKVAIDDNLNPQAEEQAFLEVKRELLILLLGIGMEEE